MAGIETIVVDRDEAGMRLDRWFKEHYPGLGFGQLQKLVRTGQVRVDGGRVKTSTRLAAGQSVRIPPLPVDGRGAAPAEADPWQADADAADGEGGRSAGRSPPAGRGGEGRSGEERRSYGTLGIPDAAAYLRGLLIYEDPEVFVFNKPAGLAVQGGSGLTRHVDGMLEAFRDAKGQKPRLVHRIDRDTSGVLVVARTRLAASKLTAAFRERSTKKVYWALVKGVPKPRQGRISTYLTREEDSERMRVARHGEDDAVHAVTYYAVVDQAAQQLSWISFRPVTGRTHQLRAHAAHIGHPIVGDPKYFDIENWQLPGGIQNRLHLHARRIIIPHPKGGVLDVSAPLPDHMRQSWNLLGFDASQYDPIDEAPEE